MKKELSFMSRFPFLPSDRIIYLSIQLADFFLAMSCSPSVVTKKYVSLENKPTYQEICQ